MKKRIDIIIVIGIILSIITSVFVSSEGTSKFIDVEATKWYYEEVMLSEDAGIMVGRTATTFEPEGKVKISEAITVASRILEKQIGTKIPTKSNEELWYTEYLEFAVQHKIVKENEFVDCEKNITRIEFANIISRVLKKSEYTIINHVASIPDISINEENYQEVKLLYEAGILSGIDECGTFRPNQEMTRAELATIVNRMCIPSKRKDTDKNEEIRYIAVKEKIDADGGNGIFVSHDSFEVSESLLKKLQSEIDKFGGRGSFYLVTLDGKFSIGYNIDGQFQSASTVKAPYSLYAFKQIEAGNASLDEIMTYENKHRHAGSGIIINEPFGTEYTLENVLSTTLHYSDNTGYYMIQDRFPISGYNEFLDSIDCSKMKLEGGIRWGYLYAREAVKIWNEIYHFANTSKYGSKLWENVVNAKYNFIKDSLVAEYGTLDYDVAHKSGFTDTARNDESIIMEEVPYILVICSQPNGRDKAYLKNITLLLHQVIEEYAAYCT